MIAEYWVIRDSRQPWLYFSETGLADFGDRVLATRYESRELAMKAVDALWADRRSMVRIVRVRKKKSKTGMVVTITRERLVDLKACILGLEWFDEIAPSGVWSSDWTPLHDLWIRLSPWCAWLVGKGLIPTANLTGADLRGANLTGADLARADLSDADLSAADLSGATLYLENLSRANLAGADLSRAYLVGANLARADISDADLSRANLAGADLYRANLTGANLTGADLARADLSDADLTLANLSWADLSGTNLSWANLRGADLSGADLYRANLTGANLGDWERGPDGYARRKAR